LLFEKHSPRVFRRGQFFGNILLCWVDANFLAVTAPALKAHLTVYQGEQSVVAAFADVCARVDFGSALADKYVPSKHNLAVGPLGT